MTDWLDRQLAKQSEQDQHERQQSERQRQESDAIRTKLPDFMVKVGKHIEQVVRRYEAQNAERPDRQLLYTPGLPGNAFIVRQVTFPAIAVTCNPDPDKGVIHVSRQLTESEESGTKETQKVDLEITVDGSLDLQVTDERRQSLRTIESLVEYLLSPVLFPEQLPQKHRRAIRL